MNKKIRICQITEATSGGVFTHITQIARGLNPEIFEQTFLLSSLKGPSLRNQKHFFGNKFSVIDMVRDINPIYDFQSFFKIYRFLQKNQFDIIHCHSSKAGVLGRLAGWLTGHSCIVYTPHAFSFHSHNSKIKNIIFQIIEKTMGFVTTKLICVSRGEYEQALLAKIVDKERLSIIFNGIECPQIHELNPSKKNWLKLNGFKGDEQIIGFVGRLARQKDPETLIRAVNHICTVENYAVVIVGDGELKKQLQDLAASLGVSDRLLFLGELQNASALFPYFDLFISTSLWEGLPYVILEALALNIPVIATKIPGVTEIIRDKETGFLITPQDHIALGSVITGLLLDKEKRREVSFKAKQLFLKKYTLNRMIHELSQLYIGITSSNKL